MSINFKGRAFYLVGLVILGATLVGVEARTFTNKSGKTVEAELMAVYGD